MTGLIAKFEDLRRQAREAVPAVAFDYVDGGAADELTIRENRESWRRLKLVPRVLTGCASKADTSCTLFGTTLAAPLLIAPMAQQGVMHTEAECAAAEAVEKCGIPLCVSMLGTKDIEDISNSGAQPIIFQQLYMWNHDAFMTNVLLDVYERGCRCVVITVDSPVFNEQGNNKQSHFKWDTASYAIVKERYWKAFFVSASDMMTECMKTGRLGDWSIVSKIKNIVDIKVLLKGILSPADAALAVENGADGIIVSNHGGRQLDTAVTAIDILPQISAAVNQRIPILVDGGIQRGTDIVKALALGASAVLIGRPVLYALAAGGAEKVLEVIKELKNELSMALALCGCTCIADVRSDLLYRP